MGFTSIHVCVVASYIGVDWGDDIRAQVERNTHDHMLLGLKWALFGDNDYAFLNTAHIGFMDDLLVSRVSVPPG